MKFSLINSFIIVTGVTLTMRLVSLSWLLAIILLESFWWTYTSAVPQEAIAEVEANLLSLFGFKRRPRVDRSQVVIPQAMLDLYRRQTGYKLDTASIHRPGLHTKSANTVRSFTHVGKLIVFSANKTEKIHFMKFNY